MGIFSRFRQPPEPPPRIEGLVGYYGLAEWWLTTFSAAERTEIEAMWGYITFQGQPIMNERPLTRGHVASNPLSAADFLMIMCGRVTGTTATAKVQAKVRELRGGDLPGFINGTHYTVYMEQAKQLVQDGKVHEADPIVDMAFTGLEAQQRISGGATLTQYTVVPPGSYWDFAVLYRKLKDFAREVAILERFTRQPHLTEGFSAKTLERLEKARTLRDRAGE